MYEIETQIERASLPARAHARLMRDLNRRVMERIKGRLPDHFEEAAYSAYGSRPRSSKYNEWKRRNKRIGHIKPNVKTGRLKRAVLGKVKITATQYGAKLTTRGDVKSKLQDWQRREIAKVSKSEIGQERKRQASEYKRGATSTKYKRKRSKRIK